MKIFRHFIFFTQTLNFFFARILFAIYLFYRLDVIFLKKIPKKRKTVLAKSWKNCNSTESFSMD